MTSTISPSNRRAFISSALPYVNAAPHLGFALELVQADVLARARRLAGHDVCFVSGTDEHSLKNVLAAERAGCSTADYIAAHAARFAQLASALAISHDAFVRTSAHPLHSHTVTSAFELLRARGDLEKRTYRGLYCVGCEQFFEPFELPDDRCLEHDRALEPSAEENWYFRLSRYRERLVEAITRLRIVPEGAREETLSFLRGPVRDLCISRSAERARGFGIAVPSDDSQVFYVWFDALLGYLTALETRRTDYWTQANTRTHVIGKGIVRFHAVYWIALLLALEEALPTELLVHGYLTVEGRKISKSGQSLDPFPLIDAYGSDAVRYYLLRHVRSTRDGDFDEVRFARAYEAELANQLGNLASRTTALIARFGDGGVSPIEEVTLSEDDVTLVRAADEVLPRVLSSVEEFALDQALERIFSLVHDANRYVDRTAPWTLTATTDRARRSAVLATLARTLRRIGDALCPFLPHAAARIGEAFAPSRSISPLPPLFPRRHAVPR